MVIAHQGWRFDWNRHATFALASFILLASPLSFVPQPSSAVTPTVNISNTDGESRDPAIAASGPNVYVVWDDDSLGNNDIVFSASPDGGETFGDQLTFDDSGGTSSNPRIAASEESVYVAWTVDGQVFFTASTDEGSTFIDPTTLSSNSTATSNARIAASGSNVYVSWVNGTSPSADIVVTSSNDAGSTFSTPLTFVDAGASADPRIAASGSNVYVTWRANIGNNEIFFTASNDAGSTFSEPVNLSANTGSSIGPALVASGSNVHVAWADNTPTTPGILVASSTDAGTTFGGALANLNVEGLSAAGSSLAVSESTGQLYVAWQLLVDPDNEVRDVFFAYSNDTGLTFSEPTNLSSNAGASIEPTVVASDLGVFVLWRDNFLDGSTHEIFSTFTDDGGLTFFSTINLSDSPTDTFTPGVAVADTSTEELVVVMREVPSDTSPSDIFLQADIDFAETGISVTPLANSEPKWGIDEVTVSGTVSNAAGGDMVLLDWGDGSDQIEVEIQGNDWGPANYSYPSSAIADNPVEIIAHLVDSSSTIKASSAPQVVTVQPHASLLELDPIAAVQPGANITLSGVLTDEDTSDPIEGEVVSLNGTGVDSLGLTGNLTTGVDGSFEIVGPTANLTADNWTVQAHYAGNEIYVASDSEVGTYATLSPDAVEYEISSGQEVLVELTNLSFNASITFEEVAQDGSIFVSECSTPASERYNPLGICVEINSALIIEENSRFLVTANLSVVQGSVTSWEDVDMFHVAGSGQVTDITQSREIEASTVSGVASSFSKFVVATAAHSQEPEGAFRQQLFVGIEPEVNTISFRNITNTGNTTAQISLDKDSYRIGDTGMVTIIDPEGNMDPSEVDIVTAGLETATSRLNIPLGEAYGITIVLHETSASSGVFQGTFNVVSGLSSGSSLQAANGDRITVAYNIPARALISIDSVSESGLLQVTDYLVPQTADFIPFGGAIKVEAIDTQLAPEARVRVSLSYANADLQENDPENLRLMQEVEDGVWIDITERDFSDNVIGVDTEAKTITGETGSLGSFSIGGDIGTVGGAGGGISRPGTGLVVDFIASIASPLKTGGGGGGGSSTPVPVTPPPPSEVTEVPAGEDNEVVVTVPPDESNSGGSSSVGVREVKLLFQNVTGSGSVTVVTETLGEIAHLFDTSAGFHATVQISEANYTTVGQIYDIAPSSELAFGGVVDVTIPYDESLIATQNETGKFSEEDVRFLHYNGTSWEDLTIGLNTTTNTVTGRMIGLSPVVAAIIDDGTFGPAYFELYPLAKVSIKEPVVMTDDATSVRNSTAGQDVTISATVENAQRFDQSYVYIVEIFSPQGHVESIILESGKLERGEVSAISKTWQVLETQAAGTYEIKIIILSSLELPYVLSEVTTLNLDVLAPE